MKMPAKNSIPVYDICALAETRHLHEEIIAENFAKYLNRHPDMKFPHRHSFYHLVYFTKGSGSHSIDFEHFQVVPGQIYFMVPGQVHSWYFQGEMDGYVINFSENLLQSFLRDGHYIDQFPFFNGIAADSVIQLSKEKAAIEKLLDLITREVGGNNPMGDELMRLNLAALFILVYRDASPRMEGKTATKPNHILFNNFRKLVDQHYNKIRLPKEYAAMLYITPNHLNAMCADLLGKPAGEIIRDRVLLEAKRMLVSSGVSVSEIAWHLHFKDNSYFTKFFKKYTGLTPEQFRSVPGETPKKHEHA